MANLSALLNTFAERKDYLFELLIQHIVLSLSAIVLITVIGIASGIFILYYRKAAKWVLGFVNFTYTIPSIALFGIFIPLIGIGFGNAMVVLVIYGLLPVIRNTYTGLNEVDPLLLDAAKGMGATPFQVFTRVRWPLALPTIISGFRTMVVMTIALAGLASFIGAGGLGQAIYRGINTNNGALILAGSLSVAILALITDFAIGALEKSLQKSNRKSRKNKILLKYTGFGILAGLLLLIPFSRFQPSNRKEITIASKPTAEQYIMGEMIAQDIESNTDITVIRKFGIGGGTSNIHPALLAGEVDIYPEYTGTAWLYVLKKKPILDPDSLFAALKIAYDRQFHLTWICRLGFNNSYTLALPENRAEKMHLRTFSDLAAVSNRFTLGAEFDFFERNDGFPGLQHLYAFHFRKIVELDVNLKFQALENHTVDVIDAFTTDSRIRQMNLRVLQDDRNYFPAYQAGIVIRNATRKRFPEVGILLSRLNGLISDQEMMQLNYKVEVMHQSASQVAKDFLQQHGLIETKEE